MTSPLPRHPRTQDSPNASARSPPRRTATLCTLHREVKGLSRPKSPTRSSCANRAHLAHVHQASRRGRLAERSPTCSLRPRADRRCRWCRREVAGATPRAHLRTRGLVSAGRWSAVGAVERTGHRPPAQAAAGARQRGGAVPPPRRPRMASPRGGGQDVRHPPTRRSPRSRPAAPALSRRRSAALWGRGQLAATQRAPRCPNYRRSERAPRTTSEPGSHSPAAAGTVRTAALPQPPRFGG